MNDLKLHEIIKLNDAGNELMYEYMKPYLKSLYTYYKAYFNGAEPVLLTTAIFNACSLHMIVSQYEVYEAIDDILRDNEIEDEDIEAETENILFNSLMLKDIKQ